MQKLFEAVLGITSPWYVKKIDFDVINKSLRIDVDFEAGSTFKDESEGANGKAYEAYDTIKKEWRHLNFFEHECYLTARVPRVKRDDGRVRMIPPPWSGVVSGFTLLFEALIIQLCKAIPRHWVS